MNEERQVEYDYVVIS